MAAMPTGCVAHQQQGGLALYCQLCTAPGQELVAMCADGPPGGEAQPNLILFSQMKRLNHQPGWKERGYILIDDHWEYYPIIAQHHQGREWLQIQRNLRLADNTIDAYGRALNDYLDFCQRHRIETETATKEHISLYVRDLATRPNPRSAKIRVLDSGASLSKATMQLRLTAVRL